MGKKLCALTFDDGPNTVTTPLVLEKLRKYGIIATFFIVGNNINEGSEQVVKEASKMGCEICNHSRTHSAMPELSAEDIRAEIEYTSKEIERITGKTPKFFRPPYIAVNDTMYDNIDLTFIAGIGAEDWLPEVTAQDRADKILRQIKDGAVILLHDMSGNTPTVEALDIIIPALKDEYEFVTVSKLFELSGVVPQKRIVYSFTSQTTEY
ncbi:MAG: polysaccharide deacetylase family protein [Oscillospiraceae bacterium]